MTPVPADCFATELAEIRIAEAFELITTRLPVTAAPEAVPLAAADGRVLAADIHAPHALPSFDHAAVDGYAFRFDDLGRKLPIIGRTAAGSAPPPLKPGSAMRIFTGAPVPTEADTVVMQEDVTVEESDSGPLLLLPEGKLKRGKNIRRAGEEIAAGDPVLPAGRRIGPAELALAASLGLTDLVVHAPLHVALLSTGDELVDAGETLGPAQRHDANRPLLAAMLRRLGCTVTDFGIARDEPEALTQAFRAAMQGQNLIISSGGVSAGEEDHVRASLGALGQVERWTMAMKPGRALAMGVISGVPVIGLPGNPVAAFHAFLHLVRPAVMALSGAEPKPLQPLPLPAAFTHRKRAGRLEALRVKAYPDAQGRMAANLFGSDSSGWLTSLTEGDGLAFLTEDSGDVTPGTMVGYLPFAGLL